MPCPHLDYNRSFVALMVVALVMVAAPSAAVPAGGASLVQLVGTLDRLSSATAAPYHFTALMHALEPHIAFVDGTGNGTVGPLTSAVPRGVDLLTATAGLLAVDVVAVRFDPACECATRDDAGYRAAIACSTPAAATPTWAGCTSSMSSAVASLRCAAAAVSMALDEVATMGTSLTNAALLRSTAAAIGHCMLDAAVALHSGGAATASSRPRVAGVVSLAGLDPAAGTSNATATRSTLADWASIVGAQHVLLRDVRIGTARGTSCALNASLAAGSASAVDVLARKNFLRALVADVPPTSWVGVMPCAAEFAVLDLGAGATLPAPLVATEALTGGDPVLRLQATSAARNATSSGFADLLIISRPLALNDVFTATPRTVLGTLLATVATPLSAAGGVRGLTLTATVVAFAGLLQELNMPPATGSRPPAVAVTVAFNQSLFGSSATTRHVDAVAASNLGALRAGIAAALTAPGVAGWSGNTTRAAGVLQYAVANTYAAVSDAAQASTADLVDTACLARAMRLPSASEAAAWASIATRAANGTATAYATALGPLPRTPTVPAAFADRGGRTLFVDVTASDARTPYAPVQTMFGGAWPTLAGPERFPVGASSSWYLSTAYRRLVDAPASWPTLKTFIQAVASPVSRVVLTGAETAVSDDAARQRLARLSNELLALGGVDVTIAWQADSSVQRWAALVQLLVAAPGVGITLVPAGTFTLDDQTGKVVAAAGSTVDFAEAMVYARMVSPAGTLVGAFMPAMWSSTELAAVATAAAAYNVSSIFVGTGAWGTSGADARRVVARLEAVTSAWLDAAAVGDGGRAIQLVPVYGVSTSDGGDLALAYSGVAPPSQPARLTASSRSNADVVTSATAIAAFQWAAAFAAAPDGVSSGMTLLADSRSAVRASWLSAQVGARQQATTARHLQQTAVTSAGQLCLRPLIVQNALRVADEGQIAAVVMELAARGTAGATAAAGWLEGLALPSYADAALSVFGAAALPSAYGRPAENKMGCPLLPRSISASRSPTFSIPLPTDSATRSPSRSIGAVSATASRSLRPSRSGSADLTATHGNFTRTASRTIQRTLLQARPPVLKGSAIAGDAAPSERTVYVVIDFASNSFDTEQFTAPNSRGCAVAFQGDDASGGGFDKVGKYAVLLPTAAQDVRSLRVTDINATVITIVVPPRSKLRLRVDERVVVSVTVACFRDAFPTDQADATAQFTVTANAAPVALAVSDDAMAATDAVSSASSAFGSLGAATLGGSVASVAVVAARGRLLLDAARCQLPMAEELPFMAHPLRFAINAAPSSEKADPTRYYFGAGIGNTIILVVVVLFAGLVASYRRCSDGDDDRAFSGGRDADIEMEARALMAGNSPGNHQKAPQNAGDASDDGSSSSSSSPGEKRRHRKSRKESATDRPGSAPLLESWLLQHAAAATSPKGHRPLSKAATSPRDSKLQQRRRDTRIATRQAELEAKLKRSPDGRPLWHAAFSAVWFPALVVPFLMTFVQDALVGLLVTVLHSEYVAPRVVAGLVLGLLWVPVFALIGIVVTAPRFTSVFVPDGTTQREQRALRAKFLERVAKHGLAAARAMPPIKLKAAKLAEVRRGVRGAKTAFGAFFEGAGEWQDDEAKVEMAESYAIVSLAVASAAIQQSAPGASPAKSDKSRQSGKQAESPQRQALVRRLVPSAPAFLHPRGFVQRFGFLFDAYRPGCQPYICAELALNSIFAAFVAMQPFFEDWSHGCLAGWTSMAIVFALQLAATLTLRPFLAAYELAFAVLVALLQTAVAVIVAVAWGVEDPTTHLEASDGVSLALMYLPAAKLFVDLVYFVVYRVCILGEGGCCSGGGSGARSSDPFALYDDGEGFGLADAVTGGDAAAMAHELAAHDRRRLLEDVSATSESEDAAPEPYFRGGGGGIGKDPMLAPASDSDGGNDSRRFRSPNAASRGGGVKTPPAMTRRDRLRHWKENSRHVDALLAGPSSGDDEALATLPPPAKHRTANPLGPGATRAGAAGSVASTTTPARNTHQFRFVGVDALPHGDDVSDMDEEAELHRLRQEAAALRARTAAHASHTSSVRTANVTVASSQQHPFRKAGGRIAPSQPDPYELL
jgi:hypothetical protein